MSTNGHDKTVAPASLSPSMAYGRRRLSQLARRIGRQGGSSFDGITSHRVSSTREGGLAHLRVGGQRGVKKLMQLLRGLRSLPDVRVIRLAGDYRSGTEIWLRMQAPIALEQAIMRLGCVSGVQPDGNALDVRLAED